MIGSKTLKMGQYWPYFLLMLWDQGTKHLSHLSSNGGSRHTKRCWSEASSRPSTSWFQHHTTGLLLLLFTFQSPQSHCAETESYTWLETIRLFIHSLWKSDKNLVNGQGSIRVAQLTWLGVSYNVGQAMVSSSLSLHLLRNKTGLTVCSLLALSDWNCLAAGTVPWRPSRRSP